MAAAVLLVGCHDKQASTTRQLTMESFASLQEAGLSVSRMSIFEKIDSLVRNDSDDLTPDNRAKNHYRNRGALLWIDRLGVDERADTVLAYLQTVNQFGFSPRRFGVEQIAQDLDRVRALDFSGRGGDINTVLARLEYLLTKGYLRYAAGQRFGYLNPTYLLNHLDSVEPTHQDTLPHPVTYRCLFDVKMDHSDKAFFQMALRRTRPDSLFTFLHSIQPQNKYYTALQQRWQERQATASQDERIRMLCNMERFRWRQADSQEKHGKYVMVNIPSYHLMAVEDGDTLWMRIGCGSLKTKTPQLNSMVTRMDINPKWFVPRSIIEKDILHRISRSYFDNRNFYVLDRHTGKEVDLSQVTQSMLRDPGYAVVQRGGKGNSLGRIIFRFDNNFSVYLHDTSSRDFFGRQDRGVSHGCVRVEKPFELARFMLKEKDEALLEKIDYCMTSDSLEDKSKIVGSVKIEPQIPIYLAYYTLYPLGDKKGDLVWRVYPDVYGYDKVMYQFLTENYR